MVKFITYIDFNETFYTTQLHAMYKYRFLRISIFANFNCNMINSYRTNSHINRNPRL